METSSLLLPILGLLAGLALGYTARRNFFCTLTSLEQYWYADNSTGVRTWALAALSAMIFTQILIAFGVVDLSESFYLSSQWPWFANIFGGVAFGIGMALVGTCGFGALVRLGGGSLKSLMAISVLGLTAISTQRGLISFSRSGFFDYFVIEFGTQNQSLPTLLTPILGQWVQWGAPVLVALIVGYLIFQDEKFRKDRKHIATGIMIGAVVAFGWIATFFVSQASFDIIQIEAASFVAPVGDTIQQIILFTGLLPDYGVGMVVGTVAGAALAARSADNVRWEACDDARELSRHILGASLMGFGGVLAAGCTIGQGVSAASLLAISVPVTMISIIFGARIGLAWLMDGSIAAAFGR